MKTLICILICFMYVPIYAQCPSIGDILNHGWTGSGTIPAAGNYDEFGIIRNEPFYIKVRNYPPVKSYPKIPSSTQCPQVIWYYRSFDTEAVVNDYPYAITLPAFNWWEVKVYGENGIGNKFSIKPPGDPIIIPDFIANYDGSQHALAWNPNLYPGWDWDSFVTPREDYTAVFQVQIEGEPELGFNETSQYTANIEGGHGEYQIKWTYRTLPNGEEQTLKDTEHLHYYNLPYGITPVYYYIDEHKCNVTMGLNDIELKVYVVDLTDPEQPFVTDTKVISARQNIIVRNLVNNNDYGTVWVNSVEHNSGSLVNVPTGSNSFRTHSGVIEDQQKKIWDDAYREENEAFYKANLGGKELAEWKYQRYIKDYLKCVDSVDENIGRVLDYLDDNGLSENTIVVYTSDQGFYLGEHGWFDKRFMYEESLHMPLLIRYPDRIRKGLVNDDMILNIDFAPLFLDYTGLEKPSEMQGESFSGLIDGTEKNWRDAIYYHYYEYPAWHMVKKHYGIRTKRYKLIHFYYDIDAWELYDLEKDPHELNNIYNDPQNASLEKELKYRMVELQKKYGDTQER